MDDIKTFYNDYICLNIKDYFENGSDLQINKLLLFVFLGLCVACFIINHTNSYISLLIRKLTRSEAFSEENSKTLSELNIGDSKPIKRLLSKNSNVIKKTIVFVNVKGLNNITYEKYVDLQKEKKLAKKLPKKESIKKLTEINDFLNQKINFYEAKFYISPDMKDYAENFSKSKGGSLPKTIMYCILILLFYFILVLIMPSLLSFIKSYIT